MAALSSALQPRIVVWTSKRQSLRRDALAVFTFALGLRLLFAGLISDTYDPDEFVHLALAHSLAHGAVPYRDFTYFHPPGLIVILRLLDAPIMAWWPLARLLSVLVDSLTVLLVWRIGLQLYGRREAIAAGVLYAVSPITLITGVRVEQDVFVTALGTAGLALLVVRSSRKTAVLAGICLAAAFWVKYPALVVLPAYVLAARHRILPLAVGLVSGLVILFAPFLPEAHQMYVQTVVWQSSHRVPNHLIWRIEKAFVFWLLVNPFAVVGLMVRRFRFPVWLLAGFGAGAVFILAPQVYYHYYVPFVPFAALLGAPIAARLPLKPLLILLAALVITVAWAEDITANGPGRQFVTATRLSGDAATVTYIERHTQRSDRILADRFEYAYLSGRAWLPYFWNMWGIVTRRDLDRLQARAQLIVHTRISGGRTYPKYFIRFLKSHVPTYETPATSVWKVSRLVKRADQK